MTQENKISNSVKRILLLSGLLVTILLTGCALTPKVADINIQSVANPTNGPVVKIVSVEDRRDFVYPFRDCETPSMPSAEALRDQSLKARAFARMGNCGNSERTMHEMMYLPEGQTVASKFKEVVTNAFRLAGYQVVSDNSNVEATLVKVEILKSWFSREFSMSGNDYIATEGVVISRPNEEPILINTIATDKVYSELGMSKQVDFYAASLLKTQEIIFSKLKAQ